MSSQKWEEFASWHMKSELKRRNLTISKLSELFKANGFDISKDSIRGKIARGKFSFVFYLQFLKILHIKSVEIDFDSQPKNIHIKFIGE